LKKQAHIDEQEMVAQARALMAPLPPREPRAGFAASVAMAARDRQVSPFLQWLRWSLGGLVLAGAAAVAVIIAAPPSQRHREEMLLAQRLELFEDMTVMQNQEALEDLDVVAVLHTLEARP
jgi:hypothetical protein